LEFGIVTAVATGSPANAPPGTVGCRDEFGVRVACGDEWISLGKIRVSDQLAKATEVLRVGDILAEDKCN
jgi:hypothetical protein